MNKNYLGLEKACENAIEWVKNNLNPHQQLVINSDGLKIVSDDYFIPKSEVIEKLMSGKKVCVIDEGGRFTTYKRLYDHVKRGYPNLPPYAEYRPLRGKVLDVVTEVPHLDDDGYIILVLTDGKYTYLLTKQPKYYVEVIENA